MSSSPIEVSANGQPLSALEALHSTPSRRYLSPDPIPDDVLWAILDAAIRGPSGGNRQHWGWVVVTDQAVKEQVAGWYRENWNSAYGQHRDRILAGDAGSSGMSPRGFLGAEHLAHRLEEAPVWVFPVLRDAADATNPRIGSSIYGAVQQLCLAARLRYRHLADHAVRRSRGRAARTARAAGRRADHGADPDGLPVQGTVGGAQAPAGRRGRALESLGSDPQ